MDKTELHIEDLTAEEVAWALEVYHQVEAFFAPSGGRRTCLVGGYFGQGLGQELEASAA